MPPRLLKAQGVDLGHCDAQIHPELEFRCPETLRETDDLSQKVVVSRWTGYSSSPEEHRAESRGEYYTIGISMIEAKLRLTMSDTTVYAGTIEAGTVHLIAPGRLLSVQTSGSYDWIHLHVGSSFLKKCRTILQPRVRGGPLILKQELPFRDPVIHDLINGLVSVSEPPTQNSSLCGESIILAIIARILDQHTLENSSEAMPSANALIAWRLKRVKDFVAEHLSDPLTLADLSQAAGLTRMHFAAQFRVATGFRPHEYLLQQRIVRAKQLLVDSDMKLVDIALAVGFQTQAHFTTVFRRIALATPHQWRCRERAEPVPRYVSPELRSSIRGRNLSDGVRGAREAGRFGP